MNNSFLKKLFEILMRKMKERRWRQVITCLAAVAVFATTYALILPAITMTGKHPTLTTEQVQAWSGEELTLKIEAEAESIGGMKTIVLLAEGEGADLSSAYIFNEDGICVITDDEGNEIELHRSIRKEDAVNTRGEKVVQFDYWFTLNAGEKTSFTLSLIDELDENRFAETVEAVKQNSDNYEKATASDAAKAAASVSAADQTATDSDAERGVRTATVSDAVKAEAETASASNADIAAADTLVKNEEEKILTEAQDDGFTELLDGSIINDLEEAGAENMEQTETVAHLLVSAGIGKDYETAVSDAGKGAEKRDGGWVKFEWKDVTARKAAAPQLVSYTDGATIAVFFDDRAGIPEGAELSIQEIEEGSDEYKEYLVQTKSAMTAATASDAEKYVAHARFFDITILDAEGNEVQPETAVKVVITYDEGIVLSEEGDVNVLHFGDDEPEVFEPAKTGGQDIDGLSFTTESFSVYGVVGMEILTTDYLNSKGETYEITVAYHQDANIPEGVKLQVTEFGEGSEEYNATRKAVLADKLERGEWVDLKEFGFAALDISILNAAGEEIEPEAEVKVSMKIKSLPGVDNVEKVMDSLEIQHHIETDHGVVVETVFQGNTEAGFSQDTDENVVAEGIAVDPGRINETEYEKQADEYLTNGVPAEDLFFDVELPEFKTEGFSTYTISWNYGNNSNRPVTTTVHYGYMSGGTWREFDTILPDGLNPSSDNSSTDYPHHGNYQHSSADDSDNSGYYLDENSKLKYLNYDFDGYQYSGTYLWRESVVDPTAAQYSGSSEISSRDGLKIQPVLRWHKNGFWQYCNHYFSDNTQQVALWQNNVKNTHVYVVYTEKPESTAGGTATLKESSVPELKNDLLTNHPAEITKSSEQNADGTNTITLTVEGYTEEIAAEKLADVILVYDNSSSMRWRKLGSQYRWQIAKAKTEALIDSLLAMNSDNPDKVRVALISFQSHAYLNHGFVNGTNGTSIKNTIPKSAKNNDPDYANDDPKKNTHLTLTHGGTNWEAALRMADSLDVRDDAATFVIFLTDGNPTLRYSRMDVTNNQLSQNNNTPVYPANRDGDGSTHTKGPDGDLFAVINGYKDYYGYSNGAPSSFGDIDNDAWAANYYAGLQYAEAILSEKSGNRKQFFTVGFSDSVDRLEDFTVEAYERAYDGTTSYKDSGYSKSNSAYLAYHDNYFPAANAAALEQAFKEIEKRIVANIGYADIQINDGITSLTNTYEKNGWEGDYVYEKSTDGGLTWNAWDPTSEGCGKAYYDSSTGSVKWNMGETFLLKKGEKYRVSFNVWPEQEAYDILAKLNNGTLTYRDLNKYPQVIWDQFEEVGGKYCIITNRTDAGYSYKIARKQGEAVTIEDNTAYSGTFPKVKDLDLGSGTVIVMKTFVNTIDPETNPDSVILRVVNSDVAASDTNYLYKEVTLNEPDYLSSNNFISCGIMKVDPSDPGKLIIYEKGHNFTIAEDDYHWELDTEIYRPMIINSREDVTMLIKLDKKPDGMGNAQRYVSGGKTYYQIDGGYYVETAKPAAFSATNYRRSNLNLTKNIVDGDGNSLNNEYKDELFEFNIVVNAGEKVWFSVYTDPDDPSTVVKDLNTTNALPEEDAGGHRTGFFYASSGTQIKVKMKPTWNLRFTNLPKDSTYVITETDRTADGFPFRSAALTLGADADSTFKAPPESGGATKVTGTIQEYSTQYDVTYTNTCNIFDITIYKTDTSPSPTYISGAKFNLYKLNTAISSADPYELVGRYSEFEIPASGALCEKLVIGSYKLEEVSAPDGYIIVNKETKFTVNESNPIIRLDAGQAWASVSGNKGDILAIKNEAGAALPATGGKGSYLYTLSGSILVLGSALLYGFSTRRKERRS